MFNDDLSIISSVALFRIFFAAVKSVSSTDMYLLLSNLTFESIIVN